ncbi:Eukaryotic mitochondrial regulator protein [Geosmithia morbida]|uniref:Eukaryotic mitochondrial regulator protein n=1 Tax=Geosmithia morbida TaxID=1094350 RepID=A0A9P5D1K2_9HYPO|nr:Eukaryotic mitochondrial regulator protein [Geosmithia morbida]KAF4119915.1 Eukaryotic mitochondrial regulator protein [Geosmithia morbida]
MPPRVTGASTSLAAATRTAVAGATQIQCFAAAATAAVAAPSRTFSTTSPQERMNKQRFMMRIWMKTRAKNMFGPDAPKGPRYVGKYEDQPFPLNPLFRSQPVLSDMLKDMIWKKVVEKGEAIKAVSQEFGVDVRRIAAVVRLKEVEKKMIAKGEQLASPYNRAVLSMLPQTRYEESDKTPAPHEPINEVPMHPATLRQLFVPVSESRRFTRSDAAKAFHDDLLSADERSLQRELISAERDVATGVSDRAEAMTKYRTEVQRVEEEHARRVAEQVAAQAARINTVATGRAAYRIKDIKAEDSGKDGRSPRGVGWRYGAPLQDRKRGQVKIPTQVP